MDMPGAISRVLAGKDLSRDEMNDVMTLIMTGEATDAQIGGFLVGLRMKGESVAEITGAAEIMRSLAAPVEVSHEYLVDTCGTGGSGANKFNVSTASAFVTAAAGARVAKHGNRAASSKSGSADLLEAAGAEIMLTPDQVARCIDSVGVGFLFALNHHAAMKHAIGPRREMVVRTIFNMLGPLTNPAGARRQVMGIYEGSLLRTVAEVLKNLGSEHVMVVHSEDGLDEISIAAPTKVAELKSGEITEYEITPEDFSLARADLDQLRVADARESLALVKAALAGSDEAASDMVALNAGAAIYVSGQALSLKDGVQMAQDAIGGGLATEKLKDFVNFTQQLVDEH
jgi:anthranilate phosphoribosyltransferase